MAPSKSEFPAGFQLGLILFSLFLGTFLVAIDTTIISVAIPKISTDFRTLNDIGWYGSAYLLTLTALQPAGGVIYKHFDIKVVYLASIVVFEVGSTICATAPSSAALIAGRAIAGVGAAALLQGAITVITASAPLDKRPLYIGLVVSGFGICACFTPIVGGALTQNLSWRWCFWINLPIGAVVFLLVLLNLRISPKVKQEPARNLPLSRKLINLDPLGAALFMSSMCCLFLALQWAGNKYTWNSPTIIGLFVGFAMLLILFVVTQWWEGDRAMIPLHILKNRTVSFGALCLFFISASSNVKLYFIPFFFQAVQATSIVESGVRFLSTAVPQIVATILAGGLATGTGYYAPIMLIGQIICSVGTGMLITLDMSTTTVLWALYMALAGLGDGLCTNMPYVAIQAILKSQSDIYIGNAIATFATLAGGAIAISIGQTILSNDLSEAITRLAPSVPSSAVVQNGPLDLQQLTPDPETLLKLRVAWGEAVAATMIFATVTICLSILPTFGLRWLNLKKVSQTNSTELEGEESQLTRSHNPVGSLDKDLELEHCVAFEPDSSHLIFDYPWAYNEDFEKEKVPAPEAKQSLPGKCLAPLDMKELRS